MDPDLVRGLVNTGNTCFLNSILQSLSTLSPLHEWLRQILLFHQNYYYTITKFQKETHHYSNNNENNTLSSSTSASKKSISVAQKLLGLLRALSWPLHSGTIDNPHQSSTLSNDETKSIFQKSKDLLLNTTTAILNTYNEHLPIHPHVTLGNLSTYFENTGGQQHDAQELLTAILNTIDEQDIDNILKEIYPISLYYRLKYLSTPIISSSKSSTVKTRRRQYVTQCIQSGLPSSTTPNKNTIGIIKSPLALLSSSLPTNPFLYYVARRTECLACREVPRKVSSSIISKNSLSSSTSPSYDLPTNPWNISKETIITLAPPENYGMNSMMYGSSSLASSTTISPSIESLLRSNFTGSETSDFICDNKECQHIAYKAGLSPFQSRIRLSYNAIRWTTLLSYPPIITLHINRLQAGYKNMQHIRFNTTLDLYPYSMEGTINMLQQKTNTLSRPESTSSSISSVYDLMAVVVHLGGPYSGHYVTHRRVPKPVSETEKEIYPSSLWVECSDTVVRSSMGEDSVKDVQAYLLFYVRQDISHDTQLSLILSSAEVLGQHVLGTPTTENLNRTDSTLSTEELIWLQCPPHEEKKYSFTKLTKIQCCHY